MKKTKKESGIKPNVTFDNEGYEILNQDYAKFHDFKSNPIFIGLFDSNEPTHDYAPIDVDEKEHWSAYKFKNENGNFLIPKAFQITKAINEKGSGEYKIQFLGHKKLEGGKKVSEFIIKFRKF